MRPPVAVGQTPLLERHPELRMLEDAVQGAAGGTGAVVVVEGAAGIGKSSLLSAASDLAGAAGLVTASARAGELERDFVWGVVRQLLEPAVHADVEGDLFAGAAAHARAVFADDQATPAPGAFPVLHGLYWLVHALAAQTPLLLVVDDAHWADEASLRWLAYLAPRIAELPVVLALATRPGPPVTVARIATDPGTIRPVPRPLSPDAVAELVRTRLGAAAETPFAAACHEVTGGNPFLLGELLAAVDADEIAPTASNAARVRDLRPETIARAVLMRLSALPPEARELARAVSVLDRRAGVRHARALAGLDDAQLDTALRALVDAEVIGAGTPLTFVHPLVRSVVYDDLSAVQVERLHARAADALAAEDAPPDAIAPHLLHVEPGDDPSRRAVLAAAAATARRRGAPALAAEYLRRALDETPAQDERAALLHALALADFDARGKPAFAEFRAALDAGAGDPDRFGAIALDYGRALHVLGDHPEAARVYDSAFARLGGSDGELARTLEAEAIIAAVQARDTAPIAGERLPGAVARLGGGGAPDAMIGVALALASVAVGDPGAAALAEQAVAGGLLDRPEHLQALALACFTLVCADRLDDVGRVWEDRVGELRRRASLPALSFACCFAAQAALLRGEPARAEAFARESCAVAPSDWALAPPDPVCFLVEALLERGDLAGAQEALAGFDLDPSLPERQGYNTLLMTRARLRIAEHRHQDALRDVLELGRRLEVWGLQNPAAYPWRSTAAVLMARSDPARARELAEVELERARAFGAPRALGVALRGAGLVAQTEGAELLRESVEVLERSPARLEHARSVAALGGLLRRTGLRKEALAVLRDALSRAAALGATALADEVRAELVTAGARPRRDALSGRDALTASERRVAELAKRGLTNRQIAEELFVTLRTVETHLTHAYRKLGVRSRQDLVQSSW